MWKQKCILQFRLNNERQIKPLGKTLLQHSCGLWFYHFIKYRNIETWWTRLWLVMGSWLWWLCNFSRNFLNSFLTQRAPFLNEIYDILTVSTSEDFICMKFSYWYILVHCFYRMFPSTPPSTRHLRSWFPFITITTEKWKPLFHQKIISSRPGWRYDGGQLSPILIVHWLSSLASVTECEEKCDVRLPW